MSAYEIAWDDLKRWLDTKEPYVVIPVRMVKSYMDELEEMYPL